MDAGTQTAGAPAEWIRTGDDTEGVPLYKRREEACYLATRDMDQLRFVGAALARFDRMTASELHEFITAEATEMDQGDIDAGGAVLA